MQCSCDSGYHVNSAGNACEAGSGCPAHSSPSSSGGCSCDSGYSVNSDRSGCEASSGGACRYANDGECDDGSQGGTQYCARGTDAADCGGSSSGGSQLSADAMRHCLNRKAAGWVVETCEDAACEYISGGCSPCVRPKPLSLR